MLCTCHFWFSNRLIQQCTVSFVHFWFPNILPWCHVLVPKHTEFGCRLLPCSPHSVATPAHSCVQVLSRCVALVTPFVVYAGVMKQHPFDLSFSSFSSFCSTPLDYHPWILRLQVAQSCQSSGYTAKTFARTGVYRMTSRTPQRQRSTGCLCQRKNNIVKLANWPSTY